MMHDYQPVCFFRQLPDQDLLQGTSAFEKNTLNVAKANREVRRRAAVADQSVEEWLTAMARVRAEEVA